MDITVEGDLQNIFEDSFKDFLKLDKENLVKDVNERNLCGRLAIALDRRIQDEKISGYFVDPEYNRNLDGRIKTIIGKNTKVVTINCDIIIHSRGKIIKKDNLIAVEMKKSNRPIEEKESDRDRLIALTKDSFDDVWSFDGKTLPEHVCMYSLGVYIELNMVHKRIDIEYYRKGKKVKGYQLSF